MPKSAFKYQAWQTLVQSRPYVTLEIDDERELAAFDDISITGEPALPAMTAFIVSDYCRALIALRFA